MAASTFALSRCSRQDSSSCSSQVALYLRGRGIGQFVFAAGSLAERGECFPPFVFRFLGHDFLRDYPVGNATAPESGGRSPMQTIGGGLLQGPRRRRRRSIRGGAHPMKCLFVFLTLFVFAGSAEAATPLNNRQNVAGKAAHPAAYNAFIRPPGMEKTNVRDKSEPTRSSEVGRGRRGGGGPSGVSAIPSEAYQGNMHRALEQLRAARASSRRGGNSQQGRPSRACDRPDRTGNSRGSGGHRIR